MNENTTQPTGALERCAELAAWHQLETDPAQREKLAIELADCVAKAAKAEAESKAEDEKKKEAKAEKKEQDDKGKREAEAKEKAAIDAEHAAWEKGMLERAERSAAPELIRERTIEVPQHIQSNPLFGQMLREQRLLQSELVSEHAGRIAAEAKAVTFQGLANNNRMEAAELRQEAAEKQAQHLAYQDPTKPGIERERDPYEDAAKQLDAKTVKEGQDVEGEVLQVTQVDGKNYYVVDQDGERVAIPAGDKPEHEKGDDITASRTKEGFETSEARDYGR